MEFQQRLGKAVSVLAAILLLLSLAFPYWKAKIIAPQYPKGLHLFVFPYRLAGDVKRVDTLNHYIGMKSLSEAAKIERLISVPAILLLSLLLVASAFIACRWAWLFVVPALLFPIIFATDLYWWLWKFSTDLDPKAPLKLPPFVVPLWGTIKIAQFQTTTGFGVGFLLAVFAGLLSVAGFVIRYRYCPSRTQRPPELVGAPLIIALLILGLTSNGYCHQWVVTEGENLARVLQSAQNGDTIIVKGGVHKGNFVVKKSVQLIGEANPILDGGGEGTVITILAPNTVIKGFTIRNSGDKLAQEDAGILVSAPNCVVENNTLENVLFGIVLRNASHSLVRDNLLEGKNLPLPRRGDLIKVWRGDGIRIERNKAYNGRDNVFWFSKRLTVRGNLCRNSRYGVHFMYSDEAEVIDNYLTKNSVGIYLMYSRSVKVSGNYLIGNRGPSGYGIGLKDMNEAVILKNLIADNRVGIFAEGARSSRFDLNLIAFNDIGVMVFGSSYKNHFTGNRLIENGEQVSVIGVNLNNWERNFWSDYFGYDANGDGLGDVPYKSVRLSEQVINRHPELRLFVHSPSIQALDFASKTFPIFAPQPQFTDEKPLSNFTLPFSIRPLSKSRPIVWISVSIALLLTASFLTRFFPFNLNLPFTSTLTDSVSLQSTVAVSVKNLTKRYGKLVAVKDVNFEIRRGETVALLGSNGAGKTTILKCLLGMLPFEGEAKVNGLDVQVEGKKVRQLVGYVPQEIRFHGDLTVKETVNFYARLRKVKAEQAERILNEWGLSEIADKPIKTLSGGMKQRLAIALALLPDPPILLLDEPTSNLDQKARQELLELLEKLKDKSKTVLICSHHWEETKRLADRVVVLESGKKVAEGKLSELEAFLPSKLTSNIFVPPESLPSAVHVLKEKGLHVQTDGKSLSVFVNPFGKVQPINELLSSGITVEDFELVQGDE